MGWRTLYLPTWKAIQKHGDLLLLRRGAEWFLRTSLAEYLASLRRDRAASARGAASVAAAAADADPCHGRAGFLLVFHILTASRTAPPCFSAVGTEDIWHEDKRRTGDCQAAAH